jgi:hypothetical protein
MMLASTQPTIIIVAELITYDVEVVPALGDHYVYSADDHGAAQEYARAIAAVTGWPIEDRSYPTAPKPEEDERVGYCPVGDVTYLGKEQPMIHNDERLDLEEYEPSIAEYEDEAA